MINIPVYRARRKIEPDYQKGILLPRLKRFNYKSFIISDYTQIQDLDNAVEIDQSTLSIHFPDWLDKNGNKIFASLNENGKGGDLLKFGDIEMTAKYSKEDGNFFLIGNGSGLITKEYCLNYEIKGIKQ